MTSAPSKKPLHQNRNRFWKSRNPAKQTLKYNWFAKLARCRGCSASLSRLFFTFFLSQKYYSFYRSNTIHSVIVPFVVDHYLTARLSLSSTACFLSSGRCMYVTPALSLYAHGGTLFPFPFIFSLLVFCSFFSLSRRRWRAAARAAELASSKTYDTGELPDEHLFWGAAAWASSPANTSRLRT
jgi:hypothetical protein